MIEKLLAAAVIMMYLGVGVILGATILLIKGNFDLAMGIGGTLALIAAGIYAFCLLRSRKAESESKAIKP